MFRDMNKLLIYYSHTKNRHFMGVYIPCNNFISTFTVAEKPINKDISEILLKFKKSLDEVEATDQVKYETFNYKHFKDIQSVCKVVDGIIKDFKTQNKSAFITIVHTLAPVERLVSYGLTTLNGEVPYMTSVISPEENAFPALDWSFYAISKFTTKCAILEEWFEEKTSFANYAGIPFGNLHGDTAIQIIDVLYSRALQNSQHVLWYSDTTLPDLGGNEDADYRRYFDQFDSNVEMCNSGFYRTY